MSVSVSGIWLNAKGEPARAGRIEARLRSEADGQRDLIVGRTNRSGLGSVELRPGQWEARVILDTGSGTYLGESWIVRLYGHDIPGVDVALLRARALAEPETPEVPTQPPGSVTFYTHNQASSATWIIPHGLGRLGCAVVILDAAGTRVYGGERHDTVDQITLTFAAAFGGTAYINP